MESIKIILLCIVSAVFYGIVHDQVTARVCVEYFTIGHAPIFPTDSPTLLGIGWGIIATWWVGLILGVPAAVVCRVGSAPKIDAARLVRPILVLLAVMATGALLLGWAGWRLAASGTIGLAEPLATLVPQSRHVAFLADAAAHSASYAIGFFGGLTVCAWVLVKRYRLALDENRKRIETAN